MAKYLSISTTNDGVLKAPIGGGLMAFKRSATEVRLYFSGTLSHHIKLTCTGADQAFIDNINNSLQAAAETSWTNSVVSVTIPTGVVVTDYDISVFS